MSRNPEYQFVSTDSASLVSSLTAAYEKITGRTLQPSDPDKIFISWIADVIIQERTILNYVGNQNLPSRAEGKNLDELGETIYSTKRLAAQPAKCTVKFTISKAQGTSILVPSGTRVTDKSRTLIWSTMEDTYVPIGETSVDVTVQCNTAGKIGNDYSAGQINTLIDIDNVLYFAACENIDTSAGGTEISTDDEYYEQMRESMDGYSCAGARGGYIYFAKRVSNDIVDVVPNSPADGEVAIYLLMKGGALASEQIKKDVFAACNPGEVRPLTDSVSVNDPETVSYNIRFTYYIPEDSNVSSAEIQRSVDQAVNGYIEWQSGKLGRDINPSELYRRLMGTGIKRLDLVEPQFTKLRDGKDNTVPQLAVLNEISVTNGGYENE